MFEDALAGVEAGRAGQLRPRGRRRPRRPARRAARARRRRRRRRPGRAAVITHPAFTVEPWAVTEEGLHLDVLAQSESVFALSNGHIGLRGNLDEGEPFGLPGTYLNGFYETRPLPYAEAGYGYPEDGQTVVNVTNGKIIRLLVDDEPFDIRYGELLGAHAHARPARRRAAPRGPLALARRARGRACARRGSCRSCSARSRRSATRSRACDGQPLRVVVQSELVANEPGPTQQRRPARRGGARRAAGGRGAGAARPARRARAPHARRAACGWRPGWTTSSRARTGS